MVCYLHFSSWFFGFFCVEHVSIYNFIFGLFIILYSYKIYIKVFLANITYIISVIIALILMFSNSTYSGVLADDPTRSDLSSC
jgi:F0F1-type ATP synthase membrane subunit c/vacuolar-type H+-ATPase subunit K